MVRLAEMSSSTGSRDVGMPADSGLGVNTADTPPNGATLFIDGSEQWTKPSMPTSAARLA